MASGGAVGPGGGPEGASEEGSGAPDAPPGAEFYLDLARRLREAHRRAEALPEGVRIPVIRRLLTVTEAVKRDPVRGSERLDRMLEEISSQVDDPPTR
ncbi:SCO5555 family protein [Nocardiopsis baichengensis]